MNEDSHLAPGDRRPRFDVLSVGVGKCSIAPEATGVRLDFLNERLTTVWLYVPDAKMYIENLSRQGGWRRASDGSLFKSPATRVWAGRDWKNEPYVVWEDTCLAGEERDWIMTYAFLRHA